MKHGDGGKQSDRRPKARHITEDHVSNEFRRLFTKKKNQSGSYVWNQKKGVIERV